MNWMIKNKEWIFSGIGVFVLGGLVALFKHLTAHRSRNHPDIAVHTQWMPISSRDFHENYDDALGIFIANTGDSPIHIRRALFRNSTPFLRVWKRASILPVYPKAFKDAGRDAYEMKFGDQWRNPQVDLAPRDRVMTYLPLAHKVPDEDCNVGRHGEVILEYSSSSKAGVHRVTV